MEVTKKDIQYWVGFSLIPGIGRVRFSQLENYFGSLENAWKADSLYIRGSLLPEDEWCLAVVGTRRATVYGRQVTEEIVADLARSKITIISGLAKGIDSVAHHSALEAGGRSLAIFACGLDTVYPGENTELARRIMQQGAIISEYPLGTRPRGENFPRRNRIMSGLSLGVLVVEAGETSGAMITARLALE